MRKGSSVRNHRLYKINEIVYNDYTPLFRSNISNSNGTVNRTRSGQSAIIMGSNRGNRVLFVVFVNLYSTCCNNTISVQSEIKNNQRKNDLIKRYFSPLIKKS